VRSRLARNASPLIPIRTMASTCVPNVRMNGQNRCAASEDAAIKVRDANGNLLADGDTVTVIKDLKVKGSSTALKVGTRVKDIRLVEGGHNIDCRIEGFGAMQLKSAFVKKA